MITSDLLRLLAISTASVVTVITFGAVVKPIADGTIDALEGGRVMLLLALPMLQFALPFSGGFSVTMVYHRFVSDNEMLASMASGVAHRTILLPAIALGLVLGVGLAGLSHFVIPQYLRSAERLMARDATRAIISPLERGDPVRVGDLDVVARELIPMGPDPAHGVVDQYVLQGVFASGAPGGDQEGLFLQAERVDLWLFSATTPEDRDAALAIQLVFRQPTGRLPDGIIAARSFSSKRIVVPTQFDDDPKYLSLPDLQAARRTPRSQSVVETRARRLIADMAQAGAGAAARNALAGNGVLVLARDDGDSVTIRAGTVGGRGPTLTLVPSPGAQDVIVERRAPDGRVTRTHAAAGGTLELSAWDRDTEQPMGLVRGTLTLRDVASRIEDRPRPAQRASLVIASLRPPDDPHTTLSTLPAQSLILEARRLAERIAQEGGDGSIVSDRARTLERRIERLDREITGKLHERAAYAVSGALVVLLGGIAACRLRDALTLHVYLWSFMPALGAVIAISAGQSMTETEGPPGLILLWAGPAALAGLAGAQYSALVRH